MALQYKTIPTSNKALSDEIIRILALYDVNQVTEQELADAMKTWSENVPDLFLNGEDHTQLSPKLAKSIGKRRATVLLTILNK